MRALGNKPGAYIVAIFDCCRAEFVEPNRGLPGANELIIGEESDYRNCILTFGCRPNSDVSAISTVASEFFSIIERNRGTDGSITFPSIEFLTWTPGDGGELTVMFKDIL